MHICIYVYLIHKHTYCTHTHTYVCTLYHTQTSGLCFPPNTHISHTHCTYTYVCMYVYHTQTSGLCSPRILTFHTHIAHTHMYVCMYITHKLQVSVPPEYSHFYSERLMVMPFFSNPLNNHRQASAHLVQGKHVNALRVHGHICMYVCMYIRMYVCMYVCMYACMICMCDLYDLYG